MVRVLILVNDNTGDLHFMAKFYIYRHKELDPFIQKCWYNTETQVFSQKTTNFSRAILDKMFEFYKEEV